MISFTGGGSAGGAGVATPFRGVRCGCSWLVCDDAGITMAAPRVAVSRATMALIYSSEENGDYYLERCRILKVAPASGKRNQLPLF
jgi:hypothetical protein